MKKHLFGRSSYAFLDKHLWNLSWKITEKKLVNDFTEKSFFLFDKRNLIKELFIIEITKLISVYGSISYFGEKVNKINEIISSNEPLKLHVQENTIKSL